VTRGSCPLAEEFSSPCRTSPPLRWTGRGYVSPTMVTGGHLASSLAACTGGLNDYPRRGCTLRPPLLCEGGDALLLPGGTRGFVALGGAAHGLLDRPRERTEQPTDSGRMIADAEGGADHPRDALGGPHLTKEAMRLRSLCEQRDQFRALLGPEPGRGTGPGMAVQRLRASRARLSHWLTAPWVTPKAAAIAWPAQRC
jgi:hypothetical protein